MRKCMCRTSSYDCSMPEVASTPKVSKSDHNLIGVLFGKVPGSKDDSESPVHFQFVRCVFARSKMDAASFMDTRDCFGVRGPARFCGAILFQV